MDKRTVNLTHSKKGGIIPTTIMFFLALCVLAIIFQPMMFFISIGVNATNSSPNGSLMAIEFYFIPLFLLTMFIFAFAAEIARGG